MLLCITHCSDYGVLVGRHRDITRTCTPQYEEIKINPSPESGSHCKTWISSIQHDSEADWHVHWRYSCSFCPWPVQVGSVVVQVETSWHTSVLLQAAACCRLQPTPFRLYMNWRTLFELLWAFLVPCAEVQCLQAFPMQTPASSVSLGRTQRARVCCAQACYYMF